jgi:hypothetical protein
MSTGTRRNNLTKNKLEVKNLIALSHKMQLSGLILPLRCQCSYCFVSCPCPCPYLYPCLWLCHICFHASFIVSFSAGVRVHVLCPESDPMK